MHEVEMTNICVDVLYNFNDTPEDFYYRLKELVKMKCDAFPMRFQPLSGTFAKEKSSFIGKHYTKEMLDNFKVFFSSVYINGCIGKGTTLEKFEETFGKTPEEFVAKLKQPKAKLQNECEAVKQKHFKGKSANFRNQQQLVI
jgi:hypothetical protein